MAKKQKKQVTTTIQEFSIGAPEQPRLEKAMALQAQDLAQEKVTLDRWLTMRGIKPHHRGGMRAFTSVRTATVDSFDEIFKNY